MAEDAGMQAEEEKTGEMDPSWQTLCDVLKDPDVSEDGKDMIRILTFIYTDSRLLVESYPAFYPTFSVSAESMQKAAGKLKKGQWQDGRQAEELC